MTGDGNRIVGVVQPTPWGARAVEVSPGESSGRRGRAAALARVGHPVLRVLRAALAGNWGYLFAVAGSIVTFVLLFQPWVTAVGPDGQVSANAFGRLDASTSYLTAWSQLKPATVHISGGWALLTSTALTVCVAAVLIHLRVRTGILDHVATIAALAGAVFVVGALLYLNSKGTELKAMTTRQWDLGGQIGSLMAWAFGNGQLVMPGIRETQYAGASLTPAAIFASITSIGSALACLSQWVNDRLSRNSRATRNTDSGPVPQVSGAAHSPTAKPTNR